jgi:hypothetical protein
VRCDLAALFFRVVVLLLVWVGVVRGAPIPADAFPGIVLDVSLEDGYGTGEVVVLKGEVEDGSKADGQILFRFTPRDGGEPLRAFVSLNGRRFEGYHIFMHDQSGTYDIEVFLGGEGDSSLGFVGIFEGLEVSPGGGTIFLPQDYFLGVVFDEVFATDYETGEEILFAGRIDDLQKTDGQILFNFVAATGQDAEVFVPVNGDRFDGRFLFEHELSGDYSLEIYLGSSQDERLSFIGSFPVIINQGSGAIFLPQDFFTGLVLDQPMPVEFAVERAYAFAGRVDGDIVGLRLDIENIALGTTRFVSIGLDAGRFSLPLRLTADEVGELKFTVVVKLPDGQLLSAGSFSIQGIEPPPAPILELGVLALALLPSGTDSVPLFNVGDAEDALRYRVSGPFELVEAPQVLAAGSNAVVRLRYTGTGGEDGTLEISSADPLRPLQIVALRGLEEMGRATSLRQLRLGDQGDLALDFDMNDYLIILYSGQVDVAAVDEVYGYSLGGGPVSAKVAVGGSSATRRDEVEGQIRRDEKALAARLQGRPRSLGKRTQVDYAVGNRRNFLFPQTGAAAEQIVAATVAAIGTRAVGWVQDDLRPADGNVDTAQIQRILDQFSETDFSATVDLFGTPSDVDGDGKVSFLFTHLVDDAEGIAGFYSASSVLAVEVGGNGNMSDIMFLSPTLEVGFYRPTLVHEFQHLINFNQHVLVRGGDAEESWLNEGLSHLSEDLVAGHATSGNGDNIGNFLRAPESVGLGGDASLDNRKRGAAYLFVRSLVDRMGEAVLLRLVGTGLADRDNVEAATGEIFEEVLAFWATQLYASGLGLFDHAWLNYASPLLQGTDEVRGLPLPVVRQYRTDEAGVQGQIPARGVAFVEVHGSGTQTIPMTADIGGEIAVLALPLPKLFLPRVEVPVDYIPGLHFDSALPGIFVVERNYPVEIVALSDTIESLLVRFVGSDTLEFWPDNNGGRFAPVIRFGNGQAGIYDLEVLTGSGDGFVHFAGGFGPIEVRETGEEITAVVESGPALPMEYRLGTAYPNPFNSSNVMPLVAPGGEDLVELAIYNALGQRVRLLFAGRLVAGTHRFVWDGRNDQGQTLASGSYVYRMRAGDAAWTRSVLLLR